MGNGAVVLVITLVGVIVAASGVFLGIPAWRLAKHAVRQQETADEQAQFNRRLMRALTGSDDDRRMTDEHPAALDLLTDIREMLREHAELTVIVAAHLADSHGPNIPPVGRRRK